MTDNAEVTFGLLQTASSPEAGFYSLGEYAQERAVSFPDLVISDDGFLELKSVRLSFTFTSPLKRAQQGNSLQFWSDIPTFP